MSEGSSFGKKYCKFIQSFTRRRDVVLRCRRRLVESDRLHRSLGEDFQEVKSRLRLPDLNEML
jgi:hypothetical protein